MDNQTMMDPAAEEEATAATNPDAGAEMSADVHAESNGQPVEAVVEEAVVEEAAPAEPTPDEIIAGLKAELAAAQDKLQRVTAEFQNTSRRQEKRLLDSIERANEAILRRLLPVMDDFDLAFGNVPDELAQAESAWVTGFEQIRKKLKDALGEDGVVIIDDTGALFDPNRHEAISNEPNDEVESGHIIQTLRVGYEHKGRILRPAMVRVAA